jgi:hypothetical protein
MGALRPIPAFASDVHILDQLIDREMIIDVQFHFSPPAAALQMRTIYQTQAGARRPPLLSNSFRHLFVTCQATLCFALPSKIVVFIGEACEPVDRSLLNDAANCML